MFLIDSDVLMTAKRTYYSFGIAPGFWDWLEQGHLRGRVASVRRVREEILAGEDDLADWVAELPSEFFLDETPEVISSTRALVKWATGNGYTQEAVAEFLDAADLFLVAHAVAGDHTVVTLEGGKPHGMNKIKIPDVCAAMNVRCIKTFEMLTSESVRLILNEG